jgi:hypothetical protein
MGIAFTIDTPLKVARYGISSVISIVDDHLIEDMRAHHSEVHEKPYTPIKTDIFDYRAKRITAYLNLLNEVVAGQFDELRASGLEEQSELVKYIELLDNNSPIRDLYAQYKTTPYPYKKKIIESLIIQSVRPGSIDVNIMTKLNKENRGPDGTMLPAEFSDALAALRGFANSQLKSSVVFSAGFNPGLYSYVEAFPNFYPDTMGEFDKKVILKVSDFRSAQIQGKFLAKKGIWVSEFRIESGLNCGGHAFATDGYLLGPILEEFKEQRDSLKKELFSLCTASWIAKRIACGSVPEQRITVQGGIGTAKEHKFLLEYYGMDAAGWGSPFLLVPEATTVDDETLQKLIRAKAKDLYLSESSPLGVPFNNLRQSSSETLRMLRVKSGKPGSPCLKKYLVSNTEFSLKPVCTASRKYLSRKLKQLEKESGTPAKYERTVAKACLCEDLAATAYISYSIKTLIKPSVAICPGPNIAYFSSSFSLSQMVGHIYGRLNVLNAENRSNMFINELWLYIDYFRSRIANADLNLTKELKYWNDFRTNLAKGIEYYRKLISRLYLETEAYKRKMEDDLERIQSSLSAVEINVPLPV